MTAYVPDEPIGFRMDQKRTMTPVAKTAAASAGFYVDEQERIWGDPAYDISLQCLTLVELIVRECADVVADAVDHHEPAATYVDKIKQHFGIMEFERP